MNLKQIWEVAQEISSWHASIFKTYKVSPKPLTIHYVYQLQYARWKEIQRDSVGDILYVIWVDQNGQLFVYINPNKPGVAVYRKWKQQDFPRPCYGIIAKTDNTFRKLAADIAIKIEKYDDEFDLFRF